MPKATHPEILTSHLGFFCDAPKTCLLRKDRVHHPALTAFQVQCIENNWPQPSSEAWEVVATVPAREVDSPLGAYLVGDFGAVRRPGVYRVVATVEGDLEPTDYSYPFLVHDDALSLLPRAFLDYLRAQRCGEAVPGYHGPCHLDDGVRSDDGRPVDATGGWHDAGDCRKWLAFTTLPIGGLRRLLSERLARAEPELARAYVDELAHGLAFILKVQDPDTGMIWEDVGGGAVIDPTRPWWFENFSGCAASNQDNRYTDNAPGSGDERLVRVTYNPVVQWLNVTFLAEGAGAVAGAHPDLARRAREAALRCAAFMDRPDRARFGPKDVAVPDDLEERTLVLAWKLSALAALAGVDGGAGGRWGAPLAAAVAALLDRQEQGPGTPSGWFHDTAARTDAYASVVYAAQPAIALLDLVEAFPGAPFAAQAREALARYFDAFVLPLAGASPFGIVPYGFYPQAARDARLAAGSRDLFHAFGSRGRGSGPACWYRFFLPADTKHAMNLGTDGHLASHAHALAQASKVLGERRYLDAALRQLEWICGANPFGACLVNGFGFGNPVPHSRFLGAIRGGIYNGCAGDVRDQPLLDVEGRMDWRTTEFWSVPLAGVMSALAYVLPAEVRAEARIGRR